MGLIGSLFAIPYIAFFYASWILYSFARPITVVSLVCVATNPTAAVRKLQLLFWTLQYLLLCNDKTWKAPACSAAEFAKEGVEIDRKTIIFVRHGESSWNDTFNKGDRKPLAFVLGFVPGVVKAIVMEWYFWVSGQANESWFYDAPLSPKGLKQAQGIRTYLQQNVEFMTPREVAMMKLLLGEGKDDDNKEPQAQLVSSNLRRAISTIAVGFQDRLHKELLNDSIMILPALQEISRNPDALSITLPKGKVFPAYTDLIGLKSFYDKQIDTRLHTGNKLYSSNGLLRMQEFCKIAFETIPKSAIIAGGHSLWFRSFFQTFLPQAVEHVAKKKKLVNGGMVGFELQRIKTDDGSIYLIDAKSIVVLHGGF